MRIPQGFNTTASVVLPLPSDVASRRIGLTTPSMAEVMKSVSNTVDLNSNNEEGITTLEEVHTIYTL